MAGGKETPRQKMIGMMYLVLTALLALNVSKEIIAAFVTINDKLESSGEIIDKSTRNVYGTFESKRAAITLEKGDTKVIDLWQGKADSLNTYTKEIVHYILSESNDMISKVEGKDWVKSKIYQEGGDSLITELESLFDIQAMDNYDIPTEFFIGGDPMKPKERGLMIRTKINGYRNTVAELMGNYKSGKNIYTFTAPDDISELEEALKTANPEDTARIAHYYRSMTLPEMVEVKDAGKPKMVPWPSAMFDHAPVVAAAAMFTALKLDVLNGESTASEFMLSKVEAPTFNFNKIEAMPFARTGYINAGDSLDLRVMIAAYDSNEVAPLRYGINDSTPNNWKETSGAIKLDSRAPGNYHVTGQIGVKEKGETVFKNWEFRYTVGKPSGTVSLPEMNVLYRDYNNIVEGAASGFPNYSLSGAGNVTLTKTATGYIAKPGAGREATINIAGVAEDGTTSNLGSFQFRVVKLPKPSIRLGRLEDGDVATSAQVRASTRLFAGYPPEIPLNAEFTVVSWTLNVSGAPRPEKGTGSQITGAGLRMLSNVQPGAIINVNTEYKGPGGRIERVSAAYTVK